MSINFFNTRRGYYCIYTKASFLLFPFTLLTLRAYTQSTTDEKGKQKVLVIDHEKTGRSDTIKSGAFIKLWFWSDKKRNLEQPIVRSDFRQHTYFIGSNLVSVTDSELVFLKRPPFIIPFKLAAHDYDTVKINEIRSIRPLDRNIDGTVKGALMTPALSIVPEYFTTFPEMLFVMPAMQITTTFFGDIFFPFHHVRRDRNNFTMHIGEIPADTMYYIRKRKMTNDSDYEWEIERLERYDKMYAKIKKDLTDKILDTYLGNKIISLTLGGTFIPGYNQGAEDVKTRLSITNRKFFFGIASEHFITERHRIGLEIQLNRTERFTSITGNGNPNISASTGYILSNFSYLKWGLGGVYSRKYKERKWADIKTLDEEMARENDETELGYLAAHRNFLRNLLAAEPHPYIMLGVGAINTTLIKVKGTLASGINSTDYSQQKFALESGFGMFTRMGKRLTYDFSLKYLWSPAYNPEIGGLKRYSGCRLQVNIGYMMGPSFARYKRVLREVNLNRD